ncbi:ParB N-terminal domain-containing protein [Nocardia sp. KC 131]|uniref:ParB N-terminal domain-containing protein n=1 Tax=Nocardia arseniciresistens TaxID=3392119 RepID=UPI00398E316A
MPLPALAPDRAALLAAREKKNPVTLPAWPREDRDMPQVELEVTWIRFSTLNGRTRAEQLRMVKTTSRPDLFSSDPLGPDAQKAQYEILRSQDGFEALKADLRERGQQEPAIITADGILINGNRRSAAMRSLFEDGFLKTKYVKCLVLPSDATADELEDLETELQVARDFKEGYSWINTALRIEKHYNREGKNWDRVAARTHRKPSDVRDLYEKLQQVHQLVALSEGARDHLSFTGNESAFDELAAFIRNKPTQEADAVKAVYFLGTLAGTEYRKLRNLRRADAAELVREELEKEPTLRPLLETADAQTSNGSSDVDDDLDDVLGETVPASPLHSLLGFVATKRPEANLTLVDGEKVSVHDLLSSLKSSITAAADEAEEQGRDKSALSSPIKRVNKAIEELQRAVAALPKARAFPEWDESSLTEGIAKIEELLKALKETR